MPDRTPLRVVVLLGGETGEREISIRSGLAVAGALLRRGHRVHLLDPTTGRDRPLHSTDDIVAVEGEFTALRPEPSLILPAVAGLRGGPVDVVANMLHGGAGEGGAIGAVLELAGIPATGSGPAASAAAMDKVLAKRVFRSEGIPVPRELLWGGRDGEGRPPAGPAHATAAPPPAPPSEAEIAELGGYPVVAKPIAGGSTVGLTLVREPSQWPEAWRAAGNEVDPERGLLVEEYIPGRELTVGIFEESALPVIEIVPKSGFYDYRNKYTRGATDYHVPADLPDETAERLRDWGWRAFRALGCRDLGRADFRLAPDGRCACLEVNTVPGMTETSLLPKGAAAVGVPFDELVERLCRRAVRRMGGMRVSTAGR